MATKEEEMILFSLKDEFNDKETYRGRVTAIYDSMKPSRSF